MAHIHKDHGKPADNRQPPRELFFFRLKENQKHGNEKLTNSKNSMMISFDGIQFSSVPAAKTAGQMTYKERECMERSNHFQTPFRRHGVSQTAEAGNSRNASKSELHAKEPVFVMTKTTLAALVCSALIAGSAQASVTVEGTTFDDTSAVAGQNLFLTAQDSERNSFSAFTRRSLPPCESSDGRGRSFADRCRTRAPHSHA